MGQHSNKRKEEMNRIQYWSFETIPTVAKCPFSVKYEYSVFGPYWRNEYSQSWEEIFNPCYNILCIAVNDDLYSQTRPASLRKNSKHSKKVKNDIATHRQNSRKGQSKTWQETACTDSNELMKVGGQVNMQGKVVQIVSLGAWIRYLWVWREKQGRRLV